MSKREPSRRFQAWINPLAFPEVDFSPAGDPDSTSAETILSFLCRPETPNDPESLVKRYKRISSTELPPSLVPAAPRILEKLVWPLREAQGSYVIGNNLSTVVLCGLAAEMVAMLLWKLAETQLNARTMKKKDEEALYGRSFENLAQARRVEILSAYGIIEPGRAEDFDTIRRTRNKYLHRWSHGHDDLQADAEKCFHAATRLVREAIAPLGFEDGKIMLNPKLVKYLAQEEGTDP